MKIFDFADANLPKSGAKLINDIARRLSWFRGNLTWRRGWNLFVLFLGYGLRSQRSFGVPAVLKVDIAPGCNLACTCCVHRAPQGNALLAAQIFPAANRMSVDEFEKIIEEVGHKTSAVSLYMLGDPLVHPQLEQIAGVSSRAGLNVHVSTNLSFRLSDARIRSIIESGITDFSACLDGFSQETYERTRIKGDIDLVKDNIQRLCQFKKELGADHFKIEIQYIKFQHNLHEVEIAKEFLTDLGIDKFTSFWGDVQNYADIDPSTYDVLAEKSPSFLPKCFWPYFHMAIRFDGEVVACSNYRHSMLNQRNGESRFLGNVLKSGVTKVWNNAMYRHARKSVVRPTKNDEGHFCYGCPALYETTVDQNIKRAEHFHLNGLPVLAVLDSETEPGPVPLFPGFDDVESATPCVGPPKMLENKHSLRNS